MTSTLKNNNRLSEKNQRILAHYMAQLFGGMISAHQYLEKTKQIYQMDAQEKISFLLEQGFTRTGAFKHVYNLDKGEEIL